MDTLVPVPGGVMPDGEGGRGWLKTVRREPIDELVVVKWRNLKAKKGFSTRPSRDRRTETIVTARSGLSYQRGVDEAVCGGPGLWRDDVVQGELLLRAVNWWDVVGCVTLLGEGVDLHRPVTILWHESVDSDCLRLYPGLGGERTCPRELKLNNLWCFSSVSEHQMKGFLP